MTTKRKRPAAMPSTGLEEPPQGQAPPPAPEPAAPAAPAATPAPRTTTPANSRSAVLQEWEEKRARELEQQEQAKPTPVTVNSPYAVGDFVQMPKFTEPDSTDPLERLDHYRKKIFEAEYVSQANQQRVKQQRVLILAAYLSAIKEEKSWEYIPEYATFGELTQAYFGFKKDYANKLIRAAPVVRALQEVTTVELSEKKHLRVLVPVQQAHGDDAVREVWNEAARQGEVKASTLEDAAKFLGYAPPKMLEEQDALESVRPTGRDFIGRAELIATDIRSLAARNPSRASREARQFLQVGQELVSELEPPQAPVVDTRVSTTPEPSTPAT